MTKNKELKVGILYEGGLDTAYVKALVTRLLAEKGFRPEGNPVMRKTGTVIIRYIPVHLPKFADRDLIVMLTDGDGEANLRRQQIVEKINSCAPAILQHTVIGVPDPHIEQWTIAAENSVKAVFGIPGHSALPHPKLKPKDRLLHIADKSSFSGTLDEAKTQIMTRADLSEMCSHSPEFRSFKESFDNFLNRQ